MTNDTLAKQRITHARRHTVLSAGLALALALLALALFAVVAAADDSMPGMDMSGSGTQSAAPSGDTMSQEMPGMTTDQHAAMSHDDGMDMGGSINWLVIGGAVLLVAGVAVAAVVTKKRLAARTLAGELAGAGATGTGSDGAGSTGSATAVAGSNDA
jgi:hypothetical protein